MICKENLESDVALFVARWAGAVLAFSCFVVNRVKSSLFTQYEHNIQRYSLSLTSWNSRRCSPSFLPFDLSDVSTPQRLLPPSAVRKRHAGWRCRHAGAVNIIDHWQRWCRVPEGGGRRRRKKRRRRIIIKLFVPLTDPKNFIILIFLGFVLRKRAGLKQGLFGMEATEGQEPKRSWTSQQTRTDSGRSEVCQNQLSQ